MTREQNNNPELQDLSKEKRVTIMVESSVIEKIKTIANTENTLPKEEIHKALVERISSYEKKNGAIKTKK